MADVPRDEGRRHESRAGRRVALSDVLAADPIDKSQRGEPSDGCVICCLGAGGELPAKALDKHDLRANALSGGLTPGPFAPSVGVKMTDNSMRFSAGMETA